MKAKPKVKGYRGKFNNKGLGGFRSSYSVTDIIKCYVLLIAVIFILGLGLSWVLG